MAGPQAARVLFGAGVPGASRGAAIVCSLSLAWGFGEVAGYARALDGKPTRAPWFYGIHVASVASGAAIVWIAPDLVSLNIAAQGIHVAMLPLVAGLLVAPAAIALPPARRARGAYLRIVSAVAALAALAAAVSVAGIAGAASGRMP